MIWASGGILLWLGGWWFTGRLAEVYRKAIYLEEADRRHRGLAPQPPEEHHRGAFYFSLFDLGLLLLGIRSLATLKAGGAESALDDSMVASVSSAAIAASRWSCSASSTHEGVSASTGTRPPTKHRRKSHRPRAT